MVKGDLWHEIHSRYKLKEKKKEIARSLDLDVRTVRKILQQKEPQPYTRKNAGKNKLHPWQDYIRQRLAAVGYCARSIFEELQVMGYTGCYETVKKYVRPFRQEAHMEATVRFETPPGKQGQVDWGKCWTVVAGRKTRAHLFVFALGYSRRSFARATGDEKISTLIKCHEEAFDHFGGIPHEIVYDNPKTVVLGRDFEGCHIRWNAQFWDFCRYYGFRPLPHRPYRPQTKGKVESGIKYVKRFLRGKAFASLEHLNACVIEWITTIADQRIHGTTHRKPAELFLEEQGLLIDHRGKPPYTIQERAVRHVSRDCMVTFETNRYSVPFRYAGKQVEVQGDGEMLRIFHKSELIGVHPRCEVRYQNKVNGEHFIGIFRHQHLPPVCSSPLFPVPVEDDVEIRDLAFYEALAEGGAR